MYTIEYLCDEKFSNKNIMLLMTKKFCPQKVLIFYFFQMKFSSQIMNVVMKLVTKSIFVLKNKLLVPQLILSLKVGIL